MGLNMAIEDADLEEVLTSVDQPLILGGKMTLFADLHSGGYSAREMAANLQGEIAFVIEEGRIQRKVELLASDALDFLFTGPASRGYTDLDCTAFRMLFEDGVGTIQVFFVETPGMRAEAFGHIDLGDESLALVINPRSKRRIIRRSSPVRLRGSLQDGHGSTRAPTDASPGGRMPQLRSSPASSRQLGPGQGACDARHEAERSPWT